MQADTQRAVAELAMTFAVLIAQRRQRVVLRAARHAVVLAPCIERRRIDFFLARQRERVVSVGKSAVMRELGPQPFGNIEHLVAIDAGVDFRKHLGQLLQRAEEQAFFPAVGAGAPDFLEALQRQPGAVGFARA